MEMVYTSSEMAELHHQTKSNDLEWTKHKTYIDSMTSFLVNKSNNTSTNVKHRLELTEAKRYNNQKVKGFQSTIVKHKGNSKITGKLKMPNRNLLWGILMLSPYHRQTEF